MMTNKLNQVDLCQAVEHTLLKIESDNQLLVKNVLMLKDQNID